MNVIVDTSVWSLVLRHKRKPSIANAEKMMRLIDEGRVVMLGPIRQEILSGIKEKKQFNLLKKHLAAFPDHQIKTEDYERAAEYFNTCRAKGIQGSNTDFLICAVAVNNNFNIYTSDKVFTLFKKYLHIKLES